jgi:hypothetical protein
MDAPQTQSWYLRKSEDGTIFGPVSFDQLAAWASEAQVAPHDSISTDQLSWIKAPMLPQLRMDWLVEVTTERYYGPTTLGAIQEFLNLGEIDAETHIINACDGTRYQIQELPGVEIVTVPAEEAHAARPHPADQPMFSGIEINVQDRIRDLEQALLEERRAAEESEGRYRELEQRYQELAARVAEFEKT